MSQVAADALPPSWAIEPLGSVVDILDSQRVPVNGEERAKRVGDVPYYGATGQVGWIDGHLFDEELVLLGEDGAPFLDSIKTKAYIIWGKSWVNNHAHVLRARPGILNRFLMHQLNHVDFRTFVSGTTRLKLPQGPMRQIPLAIAPESEQVRIVDEIEKQFTRLDAAVAALKRVQANLQRYRAAVLKAACEGRLVPTEAELAHREGRKYEPACELRGRILAERRARWEADQLPQFRTSSEEPKHDKQKKYSEPTEPETAELSDPSEGWVWTTMHALVVDGPQNGLYLPRSRYGEGTPILRIDDFQSGWSRASAELQRVTVDEGDASTYGLREGDLVINRVNSPSHLGKTLLVQKMNLPAIFESNMMRLQLSGCLSARYVEFYLRSLDGRGRLTKKAKWAVNQASINQNDVLATPVPLPPIAEQHRIVAEVERRLSVIDELEMQVEADAKRADRLRQATLRCAFQGELAPQDPNNEPASVLLERIRTEREVGEKGPGTTKRLRRADREQVVTRNA